MVPRLRDTRIPRPEETRTRKSRNLGTIPVSMYETSNLSHFPKLLGGREWLREPRARTRFSGVASVYEKTRTEGRVTKPKLLSTYLEGGKISKVPSLSVYILLFGGGDGNSVCRGRVKKTAHNAKTIWQAADCERTERRRGENTIRFQVFARTEHIGKCGVDQYLA